ncbi:uncharacterized protein LOC127258707 [Andrographis paniculata]|uniref:uncharacterized protein LOC127258707 n=1 Tax=Andrographis paniculata TaxID=175694 RepID=UPI0021E7C92B|nr:uncharacterized protein LOC127258707 [Andrographis paniculata]
MVGCRARNLFRRSSGGCVIGSFLVVCLFNSSILGKEFRNLPYMKVHPAPRKRNITLDVASMVAQANICRQKKLRRLPHIFEKALVLPFHPDAEVSINETPRSFVFTAATDGISGDVRVDAIEIHPGVTKIVVRDSGYVDLSGTELELNLWRFRLPASTRPGLASAAYDDGQLIVTVPKGAPSDEANSGDIRVGNRFVLVQ